MASIRVPYLSWRNGRPRWEPGPRVRAAGHKGRDLKDAAGTWLSLDAAIAAARAINAAVEASRVDGRLPRAMRPPARAHRTCRALSELWLASADYKRLAAQTQASYRGKLAVFLDEFGEAPVAAIEKPHLVGWWQELYDARGHHMANSILATTGSMLSYAELIGWRTENSNPCHKLRRPRPDARLVLWLPHELAALVAAADRLAIPSIGDAIIIALHSGQRQADVLAMPPRIFDEGRIRLSQFKTRALIDIPPTLIVATRVAAIRARWQAAGVATRKTMVAREFDGQPHPLDFFRHRFADVRAAAAEGAGETLPSLAGKRFQDLRDTAVTRLALAGCTLPQIGAITGHALDTIGAIMKHYLVQQTDIADAAIGKLEIWLHREGIEV